MTLEVDRGGGLALVDGRMHPMPGDPARETLGDMTALSEWNCRFVLAPRARGHQLEEPAQLDGWLRNSSAAYVESLCAWDACVAGRGHRE